MTDRETVEEKNEALKAIYAVQDALKVGLYDAEWRRQRADDEGSAEIHKKQIEEGQDAISLVRDAVHALRSRLEEVEEERDRWRAEFDKASDNLAAVCEELGDARRRAEESEEDAARYADSNMKLNAGYNRLARRADRLEEAGQNVLDERDEHPHRDLSDSREIEGLRIALDSREDVGEVKIHGNDDYQPGLDYPNPVHADEPEGGEKG